MKQTSKVFQLGEISVSQLGEGIIRHLKSKFDMIAEGTSTPDGYIIQTKSNNTAWNSLAGIRKAAQVQIIAQGDAAIVTVGDGDMRGENMLNTLVQKTMLTNRIFSFIEDFIKNGGKATEITTLQEAAEKGDVLAQNNLGNCYYEGKGVRQDYSKAVYWWTKAAEQGNTLAQNNLGKCYYEGTGMERNYSIAVDWYKKAADKGLAEAQYSLGKCYQEGNGVIMDYSTAAAWYIKASDQGYDKAKKALTKLK